MDGFDVAFFEIQLAECRIMGILEMSFFYQPTIFDLVRTLVRRLHVTDQLLIDSYYRYVDNVYIYVLKTEQYKHNTALFCLILTLIFFTARNDAYTASRIYAIMASSIGCSRENIENMESCKAFIFKKLAALGSRESEISFLESEINFSRKIGSSFKVSLLLE